MKEALDKTMAALNSDTCKFGLTTFLSATGLYLGISSLWKIYRTAKGEIPTSF